MVECRTLVAAGLLLSACGGRATKNGVVGSGGDVGAQGGAVGSGGAMSTAGGAMSAGGAPSGGCAGAAAGGSAGNYGVVECDSVEVRTKIQGVVRDPSGRVPLYNVVVFVPGRDLPPLSEGATCEPCFDWAAAEPLAATLTDTAGLFSIEAAPAGTDVPLVIQVGKWRRQIVLPEVRPCEDNSVDPELTRLPRTQAEGHLPRFAVTAGDGDSMECFLRRMGIADEEFTTSAGTGRVHLFEGCNADVSLKALRFADALGGEAFEPAALLLGDQELLAHYDAVLLGCESGACAPERASYASIVKGYADAGGRMFFDHFQQNWLEGISSWHAGYEELDTAFAAQTVAANIDMTFPKGAALADWLLGTKASSELGRLTFQGAHWVIGNAMPPAQRWIYLEADGLPLAWAPAVTLETPVEGGDAARCGRVTLHDFHVSSTLQPDLVTAPFPDGCVDAPLSPQELALEFLLFDQAGCLNDGIHPPRFPPQPPLPPGGGCGP